MRSVESLPDARVLSAKLRDIIPRRQSELALWLVTINIIS